MPSFRFKKCCTSSIKQRFEQDCFLCCLAMALGIPYSDALAKWGDELVNHVANSGLVGSKRIEQAFSALGLERDRDYVTVYAALPGHAAWETAKETKKLLWGRRACLQVKSKNYSSRYHIVYWDGSCLHDPSNLKTFTWDEVEPLYIWLFNETAADSGCRGNRLSIDGTSPQGRVQIP